MGDVICFVLNSRQVPRNLVSVSQSLAVTAAAQSELALCVVDGRSSLQDYSAKPSQEQHPGGYSRVAVHLYRALGTGVQMPASPRRILYQEEP